MLSLIPCNLQPACDGIIFSSSSALNSLLGLFRGANPPQQPEDRCRVTTETDVSEWSGGGAGRRECGRFRRMRRSQVFH